MEVELKVRDSWYAPGDVWDISFDEESPEEEERICANLALGCRGENAAVEYLEKQGMEILDRNYRCRFGEADIVALDDETLVFIEVKTRRGVEKGIPEEAITREKRKKYERISMMYMIDADIDVDIPVRFDAIGICVAKGNKALLRHHRGCFGVES